MCFKGTVSCRSRYTSKWQSQFRTTRTDSRIYSASLKFEVKNLWFCRNPNFRTELAASVAELRLVEPLFAVMTIEQRTKPNDSQRSCAEHTRSDKKLLVKVLKALFCYFFLLWKKSKRIKTIKYKVKKFCLGFLL